MMCEQAIILARYNYLGLPFVNMSHDAEMTVKLKDNIFHFHLFNSSNNNIFIMFHPLE